MKFFIFLSILFTFTGTSLLHNSNEEYFLVPYREGNEWGLCDTLGVVKIRPQYDEFIDMLIDTESKNGFFFFKRNGKTLVIDHNNLQQLTDYDSINPNKSQVYKNGKTGMYTYIYGNSHEKRKGEFRIIAQPLYDKIKPLANNHIYTITVNGKEGLLRLNFDSRASVVMSPEYDWISYKKPFYRGFKNGVAIASYNDEYSGPNLDMETSERDRAAEDAQAKQADEQELKKLAENMRRYLSKEELQKVTPLEITPINKYVKYREGGKQGYNFYIYSRANGGKLIKTTPFPAIYDSISEAGNVKFLINKDGKYGFIVDKKIVVEPIYDDIKFHKANAAEILLKKQTKYAIFNFLKNQIITDFEYDGYEFINTRQNVNYTIFLKGKKKVVWYRGTPSKEYDDLIPDSKLVATLSQKRSYRDYIKFQNHGRYGLIAIGEIQVPAQYDDVIAEHSHFFTTIKDGLKGAYEENSKINIRPQYKALTMYKQFYWEKKKYSIFRVVNTKGVTFYTDGHGKEFYKA